MSRRVHYAYELIRDRRVVARGITDDPARRELELRAAGRAFDRMHVVGTVTADEPRPQRGRSRARRAADAGTASGRHRRPR